MKTFTQLTEQLLLDWNGYLQPDISPLGAIQAVDDIDNAAFAVENPDNLDKLNYFCHTICNKQYMNPYYPINVLWAKLTTIGLNFDLKSVMFVGERGEVSVPLTQFGGRFGVLGSGDSYISSDDGISNRLPGGLVIKFFFQKTSGVYSLDVKIERGANPHPGFVEQANVTEAEPVKAKHAHAEHRKSEPTLTKQTFGGKEGWKNDERMPWPKDYLHPQSRGASSIASFAEAEPKAKVKHAEHRKSEPTLTKQTFGGKAGWKNDERMPWPKDYFHPQSRGASSVSSFTEDEKFAEDEEVTKNCRDCGKDVPELESFPGPRCLGCHAKEFDKIPPHQWQKPNFAGTINKKRIDALVKKK